jgi:hypothetical protein
MPEKEFKEMFYFLCKLILFNFMKILFAYKNAQLFLTLHTSHTSQSSK